MKQGFLKLCTLCFLLAFSKHFPSFAQSTTNLFPTPNAASLGRFGEIPVSLFNGLPNVDIPLYELKSKDLSVPISLSYHAGGLRPGQHGSWVGANWSLQAGGVITRIKNDIHDEYIDRLNSWQIGHYYNYAQLNNSDWTTNNNILLYEDCCYTGQYRKDKAGDEFSFSFLGMSGSFMKGQNGEWQLKCKQQGFTFKVVEAVGPYQFTYPDVYYRDSYSPTLPYQTKLHNIFTKFILTGVDGVSYEFGGTPTSIEFNRSSGENASSRLSYAAIATSWYLTKIISPSGDEINLDYERKGYQIVASSSSYATEYTASGSIQQSCWLVGKKSCEASNSSQQTNYLVPQFYIQDPVYLKRISSKLGSVEFTASRSIELDYTTQNLFGGCMGSKAYYGAALNAIWSSHCQSLVTQADIDAAKTTNFCGLSGGACLGGPVSKWYKLDIITVRNTANEKKKEFYFSYPQNSASRLFLSSVQEKSGDGTLAIPPYQFEYYGTPASLPSFMTYKVDHWGYYNNTSEIEDIIAGVGNFPNPFAFPTNTFLNNYAAKRASNAAVMHFGSLKKMTYPTGGSTELDYEPHSYSKLVNTESIPYSVEQRNYDRIAGGLRIKKITSKGLLNTPDVIKTYYYVADYTQSGSLSSGVLSSQEPRYVEVGTITGTPNVTYRNWHSNNILPAHQTNGNHVTYTKVTEVNMDGSYKVYSYANHDNGYLDKQAQALVVGSPYDFWLRNASSTELERGLLLNERTFKNNQQLLEEQRYEYNDAADRFNTGVRYFRSNPRIFDFGSTGIYYYINTAALVFYTYFPYLKSTKHISYDQNDPTKFITSTTSYPTYNADRQSTEIRMTQSDNSTLITRYKYVGDYQITDKCNPRYEACMDYCKANSPDRSELGYCYDDCRQARDNCYPNLSISDEAASAIKKMQDKHMLLLVEEQKWLTRNNVEKLLKATLNQYKDFTSGGVQKAKIWQVNTSSPVASFTTSMIDEDNLFVKASHYRSEFDFRSYDNRGNVLEAQPTDQIASSLVWGYNAERPIAEVKNAPVSQVAHTSFETDTDKGNWAYTGPGVVGNGKTGRKYYTLTTTTTSLTKSLPAGTYRLTYWASSPVNVTGGTITDLATSAADANNWVLYEKQLVLTATTVVTLAGSGVNLDEVRLHPMGAQMTTYTYDPLVGMTSATDAANVTTYYEYDALQRLKWLKDQNGNIIKSYFYHYKGQ